MNLYIYLYFKIIIYLIIRKYILFYAYIHLYYNHIGRSDS